MVRGLPYLSMNVGALPSVTGERSDPLGAGQIQHDLDGGSPTVARAPLD